MSETDISRLTIDRNSPVRTRRFNWQPWAIGAAVLAAVAVAMTYVSGEKTVDTVSVTTAYPYQASTLLNAAGYVVAQRKASVASKATGRLEWLGVVEGSRVRKGQLIARVENRDMVAQVEQAAANVLSARAELADAERAYQRARDLAAQNYVSGSALDSAQARLDKARAALAVAQANQRAAQVSVDQTQIRAPFDGVVLTKSANVGDVITPFSSALESKGAVVTMADMDTLEVEADVSEVNLSKISVGQPCEIQLDAFPDRRLRGVVSRTVPTVDRSKASVLVKVRFLDRDPDVLPEMSAKIAFLDKEPAADERKPLIAVAQDALVERGGLRALFLVSDGRARLVPVEVGQTINELVVVSGVKPGDKAILRPAEGLQDGDRVRVEQK
ncbi:efflux RND transporter periplasmic adaptor subunit [Rhodocyclus purpureus]|uniref:efflux RND transporter periplasmic adaptor subunit n=1 Tax=Rhodocyclus purpureus TaxID=1067 RepID=UPI001911C76B|nr:efflux RND transporter periplasmic adaptor subunit [Rhodocyclus purpureus]MBK5915742.1 efflux transporter periplasmic adaptor subunit [Rhodocyclus purpureus]